MYDIKNIFISLFIASVCIVVVRVENLYPEIPSVGALPNLNILTDDGETMNGTLYKSVKRYYCAWDNLNNSQLLTYGSNSWVFPVQDVSMVLKYPSSSMDYKDDKVITKIEVTLRIDGTHSEGYIIAGGILQDRISLAFIFKQISTLEYHFWLYGVEKSYIHMYGVNSQDPWC